MDYLLHKASGGTAELNKQVGGFSAISSVLVKLNHNKVGEMELKLSAPAYTIAIGDWVEAKGKRFYCLNNWKEYIPGEFSVTLLTVEGFGLTSNFYHCIESFDTVYSWSRDNNKVDTGSLKTFGEFFCYNVNYQQNTRLFKLGSFPEGSDTDYRVLSFTNENALSCLYEICTAYGVRYEFVLNEDEDSLYILNFYAEDVVYPETFSYEKQGGLYELNISNADGQVYTEFVVLGSEDNLPSDYPYTELHLSDTYPLSMVKYPDKYATWGRSVKELRLDVKPSRVGSVTAEVPADLNSFIDSDLIGATWSPVGGVIHIVEGPLLGFEFTVSGFNADTGKVTVEQNTENAITIPEAEYYKFTEDTKYTITGIPLPASYLTDAEARLLTESEPHRLYWSDARYDARIRVEPKFLETNGEIEAGMLLPVVHEAINLNRNFRVQSITYDPRCEQYYDVTEITISDFRQESIADSQHKAIRTALHRLDNADKVSTSIKTSVRNLDTYIDGAFADGLVSEAEAKAIEKYINIVNSQKSDIDAQFTALYANSYLSGTAKTNLNSAKEALNTSVSNLLDSIATAITDGAASEAEKADVDSKFTAFNAAISTYQTRVEEAKGAIEAAIEAAANNYTDEHLSDYAEIVTSSINGLQSQIDGVVDNWFYSYVPTTSNYPASEWTTTELKQRHVGDTFTNTQSYVDEATTPDAGKSWRWVNNSSVYSWTPIADSDAVKALLAASTAQDTADGKRRVFTTTPTTPYDKGDLWAGGASGDLKISTTTRAAGSSYVAGDWVLATKYTDDTAANAASDAVNALDTFVNGAFKDGVFTAAEAKSLSTYINTVNSQKSQIDSSYATIYNNSYLTGTAKTNLASEKTLLNTAFTNLLNSITTAIADGNTSAAEKADVDSKFTAFNSAISTYQTRVEEAKAAIEAAIETAANNYTNGQLSDYAEVVTGSLRDLQNQIDGNITTWFYAYVPTLSNTPASDWTTTETKNQHLGDLFYDTETGYCYRFQLSGETYSWVKITDTDVTKALADAAAAQDTADSKRRVFVATPTTPYDIGDLWLYGGELYKCKVDTASGSFDWAHWEKGVKYTDDTVADAAAAAAAAAQSAADDAQSAADAANALLTNIASDSKLTASEKQAAQKEWDIIKAEKTKNDTQADLYSVSKTAYTNAYNALNSYLSTLLSNLTTTSNITGSEFRGKFKDYYNARTDLLNAISNAAKAAAEATAAALDAAIQVGGRNYALESGGIKTSTVTVSIPDSLKGQKVTLSFRLKLVNVVGGAQSRVGFEGSNLNSLGVRNYYGAWHALSGTPQNFNGIVKNTFTINSDFTGNYLTLNNYRGFAVGDIVELSDVKLEKGNKPTDWTPAPEDVQAEIDDVSTGLTNLGAEINTAFSNLSITNIEANNLDLLRKSLAKEVADVRAIAVSMSVSVVDLDSKISALNTEVNKYAGKADSVYPITVTVANRTAIDTAFSNLEASIVALYEAIDKKRVDNIEIGGRNLILDSNNILLNGSDTGNRNLTTDEGTYYSIIPTNNGNVYCLSVTPSTELVKGQEYTLSFEFFSNTNVGVYWYAVTGGGGLSGGSINDTQGEWVKHEFTYTQSRDTFGGGFLWGFSNLVAGSEIGYRNLKLEKGNKATDWTPAPEDVQAAIDANASALSDFEGVVTTSISGLQAQIDGVVDSWFYAYTPTTANYPASEWTTTELKQRHVGDTFTNTQAYVDEATTPDAGKSWRWVNNSGVYSWTPIADSDAVKALLAAAEAKDTADGKRRVFTETPTTPYDKGDLWSGGTSGDLKISTTTRAAGSSYVAGDWVLATKYTDDTAVTSLENALGALAYEDMVSKAKLDSTIIDGGYIKTSLIDANTIAAGTLIVGAINDSIDAIQMGGRNLLLNSKVPKTGTSYNIGYWTSSRDFIIGETLTVTIKGNIPGTKSFGLWFNSGSIGTGSIPKIKDGYYSKQLVVPAGTTNKSVGIFLIRNQTAGDNWEFEWIKLESGNKATDWTPAPEDVQAEIDAADAAAAAAQSTANAAATAAAAAQSTANAASTAATNAQTSANTANSLLSDIASDSKFTPSEKQETKKEWDAIVSEKTKIDSQATTFGVSKTAYGTAYTALSNYITPLLSSLTTTSNITGTTFRSTFKAYYDARTDLLNAIAAKARTLANDAQTAADAAAVAAAAAVTTAASDATSKMNAAKDALAVRLGYTNYAAMAAEAAATGKLIVGGLLNANIIDVQTLVGLEAFLSRLVARNIQTTPNAEGWFTRIDDDDPTVFEVRRTVNGVIDENNYIKFGILSGLSPQLLIKWEAANILLQPAGLIVELLGKHVFYSAEGLSVHTPDMPTGVGNLLLRMMKDYIDITKLALSSVATAYSSSCPTMVWKDSKGYLKIGNTGNYTAADVGALPANTIQYFTQAQWNALTQEQKNAVPLALVQE